MWMYSRLKNKSVAFYFLDIFHTLIFHLSNEQKNPTYIFFFSPSNKFQRISHLDIYSVLQLYSEV